MLCVLVPVASAQPESGPVERWLERAETLRSRGRTRAAESLIERALERDPSAPRLPSAIGRSLPPIAAAVWAVPREEMLSRTGWVLEQLGRLERSDPERLRARDRLRAWAIAIVGERQEEALALLSESVGVHDEQGARELRRMAALFVHREHLALARRALVFALRAWSRDPELVADLAAVELARGLPAEAIRLLRGELVHRPDHRLLREDLAGALLAAGLRAEAIRLWRGLAQEASEGAVERRLRRAAGRAAIADGRYETARVEARRALGVDPEDGEARLLLGLALVGLERPEPARLALRRARLLLGDDDLRAKRALTALEPAESPPDDPQR